MPPTATEAAAIRREAIGDALDETQITIGDIDWYWEHGGGESILLTAAMICEMLAARVGGARVAIVSTGGVSVNRTAQPAELRKRATELRKRYAGGGDDGAVFVGAGSAIVRSVWSQHDDAFDADDDEFSEA